MATIDPIELITRQCTVSHILAGCPMREDSVGPPFIQRTGQSPRRQAPRYHTEIGRAA
jgi:hypothetical protein